MQIVLRKTATRKARANTAEEGTRLSLIFPSFLLRTSSEWSSEEPPSICIHGRPFERTLTSRFRDSLFDYK